ncbi:MAG: cytochrome c biogenesis protein CcdA [Microbacteriaceae bacterium]|nr:cytochrome c biogenesis protein CcdA [Microbacteriaceae bacterium]
MSGQLLLALPLALLAGLVSFASPCVLPVVPAYLGLIGATSGDAAGRGRGDAAGPRGAAGADASTSSGASGGSAGAGASATAVRAPIRRDGGRVVLGALLFVLGFSIVYVLSGALFGQLGVLFLKWQDPITRILGVVVILMGLIFIGLVSPLQRTLQLRAAPTGLIGAPILGFVFGLGWAPCLGPTLVAIQALSFTEASAGRGALLAFVYCLGLGLPFVIAALGWNAATRWLGWLKRRIRTINLIGGAILVLIGLLMVTGVWQRFVSYIGAILPGYVAPI